MLTSDLVMTKREGDRVVPFRLDPEDPANVRQAEAVIELFTRHVGEPREVVNAALADFVGVSPAFRVPRGLVKLLSDERAEFALPSTPLPSFELRRRVFLAAAEQHPLSLAPSMLTPVTAFDVHAEVAAALSAELEREVQAEEVAAGLFADRRDQQRLQSFDAPTPRWLLERYNLAQAQGALYRCVRMQLVAERNIPARYQQLFRLIKFHRLIHQITGDPEHGYEIELDGPASVLHCTTRYGLDMAVFLPALLWCTKWRMKSELQEPDGKTRWLVLDSATITLVSHYKDQPLYDSALERTFAERFARLESPWRLERETEIIHLGQMVMIPDFRFRHREDGRTALLEIVGYWRPEYLRRKFAKLATAGRSDLIVALNAELHVGGRERERLDALPGPVVFFKQALDPKAVLEALNQVPVVSDVPGAISEA
jgi:predicted nuclease of restriction endonuclease-like RecB superfamily